MEKMQPKMQRDTEIDALLSDRFVKFKRSEITKRKEKNACEEIESSKIRFRLFLDGPALFIQHCHRSFCA